MAVYVPSRNDARFQQMKWRMGARVIVKNIRHLLTSRFICRFIAYARRPVPLPLRVKIGAG